jgi:hypothetical protein
VFCPNDAGCIVPVIIRKWTRGYMKDSKYKKILFPLINDACCPGRVGIDITGGHSIQLASWTCNVGVYFFFRRLHKIAESDC